MVDLIAYPDVYPCQQAAVHLRRVRACSSGEYLLVQSWLVANVRGEGENAQIHHLPCHVTPVLAVLTRSITICYCHLLLICY